MNTLAAEPATAAAVTAALQPFVKDDARAVEVVIKDFVERGWIRTAPDGCVEISEPGRAAHETAMQRVAETRQALRILKSALTDQGRQFRDAKRPQPRSG